MKTCLSSLALLIAACLPVSAQIIDDTFSNPAAPLAGQTTTGGTDTWSTNNSDVTTNGSQAVITNSGQGSHAILGFDTSAVSSYSTGFLTLTADVSVSNSGSDTSGWIAIGFLPGSSSADLNDAGADWMLLRANGDVVGFNGNNTSSSVDYDNGSSATSMTAKIAVVIDLADQTVTYEENGVALGAPLSITNSFDSSLSQVTFEGYSGSSPINATVDNFELTYSSSAPEPSTWTLMLGGLILFAAAFRMRQSI